MESAVITTIISTSAGVVTALGGMWIVTNQIGKRIDALARRMERLESKVNELSDRLARVEGSR